MKFDFETHIYKPYPRHEGKKKGISKLEKTIQTEKEFQELKLALSNYIALLEKLGTDKQYIKHFSTWVNCWEDYLEIDPKEQSMNYQNLSKEKKEALIIEMLQSFRKGEFDESKNSKNLT